MLPDPPKARVTAAIWPGQVLPKEAGSSQWEGTERRLNMLLSSAATAINYAEGSSLPHSTTPGRHSGLELYLTSPAGSRDDVLVLLEVCTVLGNESKPGLIPQSPRAAPPMPPPFSPRHSAQQVQLRRYFRKEAFRPGTGRRKSSVFDPPPAPPATPRSPGRHGDVVEDQPGCGHRAARPKHLLAILLLFR